MRSPIRKDYSVILHDYKKWIEIKYSQRRNHFNKDLHFRILTNMDIHFNTNWRMVKKPDYMVNNFYGLLACMLFKKVPAYDIIFYFHGGGFVANTSEAHSDYLRRYT